MFEHFGFWDALAGLWRKKWQIVAVTVLCGILGVAAAWAVNHRALQPGKEDYLASRSYYLEFEDEGMLEDSSKNAATTLNTMLDADFCMTYVTDYITEAYGEEQTKQLLGVSADEELAYNVIPDQIHHSILSDGNSVNLYLHAADEKFAETVITAYDSYIAQFVKDMGNIRVVNLGGIQKESDSVDESSIGSLKAGVIGAAAGFVLSCIVVFFAVLFVPVLNRESDFDEYGIRVFGRM